MREKGWPFRDPLFLDDTQWAIAGKVPVSALEAARHEISDWIPLEGSKVVVGKDEFAALLFFGGAAENGETLSMELSRDTKTPIFLLDFDDNYPSIREYDGAREKWKRGLPSYFLSSRGIIAPGYGPRPPSPVKSIGVVEGATLAEACRALPKYKERFGTNSRGVLVKSPAGILTLDLARKLERRSFTLFYNQEDRTFSCDTRELDDSEACFSPDKPNPNYEPIDSILGETTLDGVLRVLDIPRHLLFPEDSPPGTDTGSGGRTP